MIWKLLTALLMTLSGFAFQPSQDSRTGQVYIALGDSVAAGIGSSLPRKRSYPAVLGRLMASHLEVPVRVENLARPGESASSFLSGDQPDELERLVADVGLSDEEVRAVTVSLGGNEVLDLRDASRNQREGALDQFATNYPEALAAVRDLLGESVPVLAATVYDPTGGDASIQFTESWWIEQFNTVIRDAASQFDVEVVDLASELGSSATELTRYPVDVHPTNEGHARIAAIHWESLGLDVDAPEIDVLSGSSSARYTPTVRFRVSEAVGLESISVASTDESAVIYEPLQVGEREFAMLVDASADRSQEIGMTISAADLAGNRAEVEVLLEFTDRR